MPKWVYPLSFVFLLFLVFGNGTGTGQQANEFAGFIGEMLTSIGQFLTGMFEGSDGVIGDPNSQSGDVFNSGANSTTTHTHGG